MRLFTRYARRYVQRSFHAVRLLRTGQPPQLPDRLLVVYCNHPSWWDPLLGLLLAQRSCPHPLRAYGRRCPGTVPLLCASGLFGLATGTRQGAATLLRVAQAMAQQPQMALWITPEEQFTDPRSARSSSSPGLGTWPDGSRPRPLPLALEYPFWEERFPEALACFGDVVLVDQLPPRRARDWTALLARQLEATQDRLAEAARRHDREAFETLLRGRAGSAACMIAGVACAPGNAARHSSKRTGGRLMLLEVLAATTSLCAALPACLFHRNIRLYAPPPVPHPGTTPPAMAVLIPARNEARTIRAAVEAALHSQHVILEVLVLDDHSTDATAQIVRDIAARDAVYACCQGRRCPLDGAANNTPVPCSRPTPRSHCWSLSTPMRLAPQGLARLAAFLDASGADLVSGLPRQETGTVLERLLVPLIHFLLLGFLPVRRMRQSRHPAYGAGCGQVFMARRQAYVHAGGHAAIRPRCTMA